ncbi:peptidase E [Bacillus suaedaesalsae]|uniref:Peptidase E n=1 Tax=Bacillus suaedaesalsae TaxID=2810349 RepID=A0ABS2DI29_9BACI|nr:peptidase E [Bacillus suaedaesalsae]MBM6618144.1 peptidase E [Bacillus suaedaesalsae]
MESCIKRQIFAMGGGGFSMEPDNPLLDRYILSLVNKERPRICFVPTATGDADGYINRFYQFFGKEECDPFHLSVYKLPDENLENYVLSMDIIYVGGGNTKNLLALWREWGLDEMMKKAYKAGVILTGLSAGSICWFEEGLTDSYPGSLRELTCLGILKGSNAPHYDGEIDRRPRYHQLMLNNRIIDGIGVDDGVGVHFVNENIFKIVSSRPNARAYDVRKIGNQIVETPLQVEYLGIK